MSAPRSPFAAHPQCDELVSFSGMLADEARRLLLGRHQGSRYLTKDDDSPVTEFDRAVEARLRELIRTRFPEHGIIGEEFPPETDDAEFVWMIDPIDGTKAFVAGVPTFTTLVALCHRELPVIGVIDSGVTDDRWLGVDGRATLHNGTPVTTSGRRELDGATVAWSNPEAVLDEQRAGAALLNRRTAWRVFGAGSYGYGRLASGAIDLAVESGGVIEVDIVAAAPIVNGAGGVCTDGFGAPLTMRTQGTSVAAASPELHAEAIRTLNSRG